MDRTTLTITDAEFEQNVEAAVSAIAEKHRSASPPPPVISEKNSLPLPQAGESSARRPSMDGEGHSGTPRRSTSADGPDGEQAAISGLFRSIQRPLSSIGRMFSDEPTTLIAGTSARASTERPPPRQSAEGEVRPSSRQAVSAEEAAARQASAEAAEAQRLHRAEHSNIVDTLAGMFPDLDREIISDVVYQKEGRYVVLLLAPPIPSEVMLTTLQGRIGS